MLPWQQLSYDPNDWHFWTSLMGTYFHANLSGGSNFFISHFVWFLQRIALKNLFFNYIYFELNLSCVKHINKIGFTASCLTKAKLRTQLVVKWSKCAIPLSSRPLSTAIKRDFLIFSHHTHIPPFFTAVVFMLATSDPAPCSLTPRQAT